MYVYITTKQNYLPIKVLIHLDISPLVMFPHHVVPSLALLSSYSWIKKASSGARNLWHGMTYDHMLPPTWCELSSEETNTLSSTRREPLPQSHPTGPGSVCSIWLPGSCNITAALSCTLCIQGHTQLPAPNPGLGISSEISFKAHLCLYTAHLILVECCLIWKPLQFLSMSMFDWLKGGPCNSVDKH